MSSEIKTADVVYRKDLYPRFEPNQAYIQRYADSIEYLPPIKVNQHNILIDGFHRWKAHQVAEKETINIELVETESEKQLKKLAYQLNSNHGLQLSNDEKRKYAIEMIGESSIEELSQILSVSKESITKWTKDRRDALKEERDRNILEDYLRAWNTQEMIAEKYNLTKQAISDILSNNSKNTKIGQNFSPFLYTIWNTNKADNQREHFGQFPQVFMENLLYYHTDPFDIVYDPFAGGGTTIDACKKWLRRYYCTDCKVIPGREEDIKEWKIQDGLPSDLQKPKLIFLDPPYRVQAKDKYSDNSFDLGNMDLIKFMESMKDLLKEFFARKIEKISIVIAPSYKTKEHGWEDYIFMFHEILCNKYKIVYRYSLPYSTEQYRGSQVELAKEMKVCMNTMRDLIVWEYK